MTLRTGATCAFFYNAYRAYPILKPYMPKACQIIEEWASSLPAMNSWTQEAESIGIPIVGLGAFVITASCFSTKKILCATAATAAFVWYTRVVDLSN
ncbi:MAG: hypothetical protein S4CHLAM123_14010 [Chlamydiales bacterium]|nr:hypothetical protein [Chlamydiales bacterium]